VNVRLPVVAGTFYPADPQRLRSLVEEFLAAAPVRADSHPRALIVPHAGYAYSGPVAASGYVTIHSEQVSRVVMVGPSHFVGFRGLATPGVEAFRTPLGDVPVHGGEFPALPAAHAREHSLEVQLPFLQVVLTDFDIVPLVVGNAHPREVAEALDPYATDPSVLIVVSSDLSHYLPYDQAQFIDEETAEAIRQRTGERLGPKDACGLRGIQGVLVHARRHDLQVRILDLRNSGDTQGDRDRVVGYGAFWIG
jgi:hypothetical protein